MVKLVNQTKFAAKIKEKKLPVFTARDIRSLFGLREAAVSKLLHRYTQQRFILRLKRGLYALADTEPPELFLANILYEPSYISREFALSYHRVIPETVYEITSVTSKATRRFEKLGKIFSYRKIKKTAFAGYETARQNDLSFRIADAEKAFVDADYFRLLDKLKPISRFDKEKINPAKALRYASLFNNEKLTSIIKTTLK
jgi:predicted transcriptional regulator of viral defense system